MRKSKITDYRPELSVKENANHNGVSEAAIRYYIKANGLSRRLSAKIGIYKKIHEQRKTNPKQKPVEIAHALGLDVRTVRTYLDCEPPKPLRKAAVSKEPKIKHYLSIMNSTTEILKAIIELHVPEGRFACDLTAGECGFYKDGIKKPAALFDKYAADDDENGVERFDVFLDGNAIKSRYRHVYSSIIVDLPVSVRSPMSRKQVNDVVEFRDMDDLYSSHRQMLIIAGEMLKNDGIMVYTTMDVAFKDEKKQDKIKWVSEDVLAMARSLDFELIDKYIYSVPKYAKRFSKRAAMKTQIPAHSYFYVFKKKLSGNS